MDWEKLCKELQLRIAELEKENRELRCRLGLPEANRSIAAESPKPDAPIPPIAPVSSVHMRSTPEEKIHLFRSLFRGREDVFARRWYSVQKGKGENRALVPLDDTIIYKHLKL